MKSFRESGPYYKDYYTDEWTVESELSYLQQYARIGYEHSSEQHSFLSGDHDLYLSYEYGANDLMFMRMIMVDFGLSAKPQLVNKNIKYPILPARGADPWTKRPNKVLPKSFKKANLLNPWEKAYNNF
jgi:hypothetical protein